MPRKYRTLTKPEVVFEADSNSQALPVSPPPIVIRHPWGDEEASQRLPRSNYRKGGLQEFRATKIVLGTDGVYLITLRPWGQDTWQYEAKRNPQLQEG